MSLDKQVGVGDFVLLPQVNMESFLENLKVRHAGGFIYTYIGKSICKKYFLLHLKISKCLINHFNFFIYVNFPNQSQTGEVCVSVNPYKTMDMYGPEYVDKYR